MLHVWNIYLQKWAIFGVNVGKYSGDQIRLSKQKKHGISSMFDSFT
jgi:hypothetical protein